MQRHREAVAIQILTDTKYFNTPGSPRSVPPTPSGQCRLEHLFNVVGLGGINWSTVHWITQLQAIGPSKPQPQDKLFNTCES